MSLKYEPVQAVATHTTIFRLSPHFGSPSFDPLFTIDPAISSGRTTTVNPQPYTHLAHCGDVDVNPEPEN